MRPDVVRPSSHAESPREAWPALPLEAWRETRDTLHMWMQIVGKIRLKLTPLVNHWWEVPFYLTSRGLTTTPIPFDERAFDATFDFIDHALIFQTSEGQTERIPLRPRSVADFYHDVMGTLRGLGIGVRIWTMPSEPASVKPWRAAFRVCEELTLIAG